MAVAHSGCRPRASSCLKGHHDRPQTKALSSSPATAQEVCGVAPGMDTSVGIGVRGGGLALLAPVPDQPDATCGQQSQDAVLELTQHAEHPVPVLGAEVAQIDPDRYADDGGKPVHEEPGGEAH